MVVWARLSNSQSIGYSYMAISKRLKITTLLKSIKNTICTILHNSRNGKSQVLWRGQIPKAFYSWKSAAFTHFRNYSMYTVLQMFMQVSFWTGNQGNLQNWVLYIPHHLRIRFYVNFLGRLDSNGFQLKWSFGTLCNWKKSKFWGPFWSYQLNNTAN